MNPKLGRKRAEPTTEELVAKWLRAKNGVERIAAEAQVAESELADAVNELGKRIDPGGIESGEKIGMWVRFSDDREGVIYVKRGIRDGTYELEIREPKQ